MSLFLVSFLSSFSFSLDTDKNLVLSDSNGDSPSIILRNEKGGEGTIKKVNETNSFDFFSQDGAINLKSKSDDNYISIDNVLSNVTLFFKKIQDKKSYGLRLNKENDILEIKDSRNEDWKAISTETSSGVSSSFPWKIQVKNSDFNVSKEESGTYYVAKKTLTAHLPSISEIPPNFIISLKRKSFYDVYIVPAEGDLIEGKNKVKFKNIGAHLTLISDGASWHEFYKNGNIYYYEVSGDCPENYVSVPPNPEYGIVDSFCVAKYEMKKGANGVAISQYQGVPWVRMTQESAKAACENIGEGYHLITNAEWMTVVRNMELVEENWENGEVGLSRMNRGRWSIGNCSSHSGRVIAAEKEDTHPWSIDRRTHYLSTGDVIWDMAGNAGEFVDWPGFLNFDFPTPNGEIKDTTPTEDLPKKSYFPIQEQLTNHDNSIGNYKVTANHNSVIRGGSSCPNFSAPGLFSLSFHNVINSWNTYYPYDGFRCAYSK